MGEISNLSYFVYVVVKVKATGSLIMLAVLFCMLAAPTQAQESSDVHPYITNKFIVNLGTFFPDRKLKVRASTTISGMHAEVDFEKELRLKRDDEVLALNLAWRFGDKYSLSAQYFETQMDSGTILEQSLEWNSVVFVAGRVHGGQKFELFRVFLGRSFDTGDRHDFGVGAGIHWLEVGAFIEGNVILRDGRSSFRREAVSVSSPLPNVGAWYLYSLSPRWALRSRIDWLEASVGEYKGKIVNASLGLNFQAFDHFGIGLDYNLVELDIDVSKSDWRGNAKVTYDGLYASVSFNW